MHLFITYHSSISSLAYSLPKDKPKKTIAGVTVLDTPIIQDAKALALSTVDQTSFNHVMRSWLLGALVISKNDTLSAKLDHEAVALGIILHDLGLDEHPNSLITSKDRRFEVDAAIAARNFIRSHSDSKNWDERRVDLPLIAKYKQLEVQMVAMGYEMGEMGPGDGVSAKEHEAVLKEFPVLDFDEWTKKKLTWICTTKPATTYDTWQQSFGETYVANYSAKGHRMTDHLAHK
ncbi:hypothetical protein BT63DRAFT_433173 [Microthyrium microscopicum]|uniref:HD domain-containing protein n=1 Tax=Microthyrium microscopicum TaxID=703497 RepID=A0A6A6UA14_9PEZI|nr:hypothetical protein BT63DRAFT_433173 [Microthyrium microscopicum]